MYLYSSSSATVSAMPSSGKPFCLRYFITCCFVLGLIPRYLTAAVLTSLTSLTLLTFLTVPSEPVSCPGRNAPVLQQIFQVAYGIHPRTMDRDHPFRRLCGN